MHESVRILFVTKENKNHGLYKTFILSHMDCLQHLNYSKQLFFNKIDFLFVISVINRLFQEKSIKLNLIFMENFAI